MCLICGHVGCGRYKGGHAYHHFTQAHHHYAMELETQRVWDYAGDGYVHRLIQNQSDGQLVELPDPQTKQANSVQLKWSQDKVDAIGLEFTHLLTSSLESQRAWYEDQLSSASLRVLNTETKYQELQSQFDRLKLEKTFTDETLTALHEKVQEFEVRLKTSDTNRSGNSASQKRIGQLEQDVEEERAVTKALLVNQTQWQEELKKRSEKVKQLEKDKAELQDQLRDIMMHLDAQQKLDRTAAALSPEERQNLSINIRPSPQNKSRRRK
jgi:BRCA1-associated protein